MYEPEHSVVLVSPYLVILAENTFCLHLQHVVQLIYIFMGLIILTSFSLITICQRAEPGYSINILLHY
jgi:hypothetical protein